MRHPESPNHYYANRAFSNPTACTATTALTADVQYHRAPPLSVTTISIIPAITSAAAATKATSTVSNPITEQNSSDGPPTATSFPINTTIFVLDSRETEFRCRSSGNALETVGPVLDSILFPAAAVERELKNLKEVKSSGPDNIPAKFLKELANELSKPLAHIFRSSFELGRLPSEWKTANIFPIYKGGARTNANNYRPTNLGDLGQRYFDALNLQKAIDLQTAFTKLESAWGGKDNVFLSRYRFCQMRQESNQCVSDFISNLTLAIQDCGYKEIKADNFEHAMLVQQLIVGLRDEKARENLLSEKKDLSWDKACDIASHRERVRQNLQQLNQSNDGVIASLESEMAVFLVNAAVSSPRQ
nr:unnamed protein product [Spirometra erinaceieuropaei]